MIISQKIFIYLLLLFCVISSRAHGYVYLFLFAAQLPEELAGQADWRVMAEPHSVGPMVRTQVSARLRTLSPACSRDAVYWRGVHTNV